MNWVMRLLRGCEAYLEDKMDLLRKIQEAGIVDGVALKHGDADRLKSLLRGEDGYCETRGKFTATRYE
jgi:hypothetical protein